MGKVGRWEGVREEQAGRNGNTCVKAGRFTGCHAEHTGRGLQGHWQAARGKRLRLRG